MRNNKISRQKFIAMTGLGVLGLGSFLRPFFSQATEQGSYINLFNGKNLEGWHRSTPNGGRWSVEDGVLIGEQDPPGSGNGGFLLTDQQFDDFEMILDMKPDWGVDTGVFIRTNDKGEGIQVYVDYREHGDVGRIRGIYQSPEGKNKVFLIRPYNIYGKYDAKGQLIGFYSKPDRRDYAWDPTFLKYNASPQEWINAWKIGEWNTMRIRCQGKYPRIKVWINDAMIADFDGETCPNPQYDREQFFKSTGGKGSVAVQVHGGSGWPKGAKCRWKNMQIVPL